MASFHHGSTFMVFSLMPCTIRLSALMGVRVINVLTHDSIGLGGQPTTNRSNIWPACAPCRFYIAAADFD